MDPHAVLGVPPAARPDEVTAAYRRLAKRHHPDRPGADGERMRLINAAYQQLRDQMAGRAKPPPPPARAPRSRAPGSWLPPAVRSALGHELLNALAPDEDVQVIADAATWDAHDVRVVVTDRRLLWLRDDALTDRVRAIGRRDIARIEQRRARRGRAAEVRVHLRESRRPLEFGELAPDRATLLARALVASGTA